MQRHDKTERGKMGVVITAILLAFLALHIALPEITLWPFLVASLVIIPMLVRHFGGSDRRSAASISGNNSTRG